MKTETKYCVVMTVETREELERLERNVFSTRTGAAAAIDGVARRFGITSFEIEPIEVEAMEDRINGNSNQ